jgi:hypothetical protein
MASKTSNNFHYSFKGFVHFQWKHYTFGIRSVQHGCDSCLQVNNRSTGARRREPPDFSRYRRDCMTISAPTAASSFVKTTEDTCAARFLPMKNHEFYLLSWIAPVQHLSPIFSCKVGLRNVKWAGIYRIEFYGFRWIVLWYGEGLLIKERCRFVVLQNYDNMNLVVVEWNINCLLKCYKYLWIIKMRP